jgi:hypothetical protein
VCAHSAGTCCVLYVVPLSPFGGTQVLAANIALAPQCVQPPGPLPLFRVGFARCDCDCVLKRAHSILESCATVRQEAVLGCSPSVRRSYSASTLWIITSVFRPRLDSKLTVDSFGYPGRH